MSEPSPESLAIANTFLDGVARFRFTRSERETLARAFDAHVSERTAALRQELNRANSACDLFVGKTKALRAAADAMADDADMMVAVPSNNLYRENLRFRVAAYRALSPAGEEK